MSTNPNPSLITDSMWRLWDECPIPAQLSGFYADKKGYHNTVINNQKKWPDNYSIKLPLDLVNKNRDKARAIDLTMGPEMMKTWTLRMKTAAENKYDTRLMAVKEFYGTLDGKTVFGLSKDSATGAWRRVSADDTHLWHGHTSIFTAFVADWNYLKPLLSVWKGESFSQGVAGVGLPVKNDQGEDVVYWQYMHNMIRNSYTPPLPTIDPVDGSYGMNTAAAFSAFGERILGLKTYDGTRLLGYLAMNYQKRFAELYGSTSVTVGPEAVEAAVASYLKAHPMKVVPSDS